MGIVPPLKYGIQAATAFWLRCRMCKVISVTVCLFSTCNKAGYLEILHARVALVECYLNSLDGRRSGGGVQVEFDPLPDAEA